MYVAYMTIFIIIQPKQQFPNNDLYIHEFFSMSLNFQFSSKENRDAFVNNPAHYVPKYNGYCAFAVGAKGAKVPANPDSFKLYNGELLVFFNDLYDGKQFNTKIPWNADERKLHSQAETNWKKLNGAQ